VIAALALAAAGLAQPQLQPWSYLVGHCWRGPAPGKGIDTHCFEAVYGGQHVRDRHEVQVDGRIVYAGETIYSVEGKDSVTFTYWNSIGGVGHGRAVANGAEIDFSGDIHATPTAPGEHFTAKWIKVDGGYAVTDDGRRNDLFRRAD